MKCSYVLDNGKKCQKKSHENVLCDEHQIQSGGSIMSMVYPLGTAVGTMTLGLIKFNNMFGDYVLNKKGKGRQNQKN